MSLNFHQPKSFLASRLGEENAEIIRISEPIKAFWATKKSLDLTQLLSDGAYKERYRKEMIVWSDEMRAKDFGIFCREASKRISKQTVIVSDIRRKTDIRFFRETFGNKIKLIRIVCSDCIRQQRGWKFEAGVDDIQSECDLDDWNEWDLLIENTGERDENEILDEIFQKLIV
jgi:phosphomevalonate kinase